MGEPQTNVIVLAFDGVVLADEKKCRGFRISPMLTEFDSLADQQTISQHLKAMCITSDEDPIVWASELTNLLRHVLPLLVKESEERLLVSQFLECPLSV